MRQIFENLPGFEKEMSFGGYGSGAALNKDGIGLDSYKKQKHNLNRLIKVEEELSEVRSDIKLILELLKKSN